MRELRTEIAIDATPERVWEVLTDFPSYPAWNPFVVKAEGAFEEAGRVEVRLSPPGGRAMTFKPRVLKWDPAKEFRWLGSLGPRGIFDGEHIFELEPTGTGGTNFVQREVFRGLLVPLLLAMIGKNTRAGFEAMNQALKQRAEAAS